MLLLLIYASTCISYKKVYYGTEESRTLTTIEQMFRDVARHYPDDQYFQKMCNEAIKAVSNFKYEFHPKIANFEILSDLSSNYNVVEIDFNNTNKINIDLAKAYIQVLKLESKRDILQINSSIRDVSKSLPYVYISSNVNFVTPIKFNTIVMKCFTTTKCTLDAKGEVIANYLITPNIEILQSPQIKTTKRIFCAFTITGEIRFNKDYVEVNGVQISDEISIMLTPYVYESTTIEMVLQEGVTQPKSLKIYFDDPSIMLSEKIYNGSFNIYYYFRHQCDRKSSLQFAFKGDWGNVQNFNLTLVATDVNKPYLDVSTIPSNINYKLEDDDLLHFKIEESTSHGMRSFLVAPFALISFLVGIIFTIIV